MGAKWGFHKFPLDPHHTASPSLDELSWHSPPAAEPRPTNDPLRLDIPFDLSLPLPPQLEAAKLKLISRAAELRRSGQAAPMTVSNQCARWTRILQLLDDEAIGEAPEAEEEGRLLKESHTMLQGEYLLILRLGDN